MNCVICRHAETQPGAATVTLQRGDATLVFKAVPAQVCPNCGEEYISEATTQHLLHSAEEAVRAGSQVDVRLYRDQLAA